MRADILPASSPDSPLDWSLQQASFHIRRGQISPVELTRACLERIERLNPKLNAFITVTADQAMAQAQALEEEGRAGRWRGPLHGIPIGLKDLIDLGGVKTTCASAVFADRVPDTDAEVVVRLKRAGAVVVGKQNMQEFAIGATSVESHFGAVHNPWDLQRIAGGSSGGSAAAVAASLCFGSLGSDTGGSIRQPSAFCGLTGLKPSYGRVSTRGIVPLSWSLDHVGLICRTAADAALLLEAIAGYDADDVASVDQPVAQYTNALGADTSKLKVGVIRNPFFSDLDPEIGEAVAAALSLLESMVGEIREVEFPALPALPIALPECLVFHAPYLASKPELYLPATRARLHRGMAVNTAAYVEARRELDRLRRSTLNLFASADLLVTPTTHLPPPRISEFTQSGDSQSGGSPLLRNTRPFNALGLPAVSICCGFHRDGLPIGLQIIGPSFGESRVLSLAHAYQQVTSWHTRRPRL